MTNVILHISPLLFQMYQNFSEFPTVSINNQTDFMYLYNLRFQTYDLRFQTSHLARSYSVYKQHYKKSHDPDL